MTRSEAAELKAMDRVRVKGEFVARVVSVAPPKYGDPLADCIATDYGYLKCDICEIIKLPRLYLAGPMTGLPENNYPEFNRIADYLRRQGFHVENPAENDLPENSSWADYMRVAIGQLIKCDVVVQLEGWEKSEGARFETDIALRLKILTIPYASDEFVNWLQRTVEG